MWSKITINNVIFLVPILLNVQVFWQFITIPLWVPLVSILLFVPFVEHDFIYTNSIILIRSYIQIGMIFDGYTNRYVPIYLIYKFACTYLYKLIRITFSLSWFLGGNQRRTWSSFDYWWLSFHQERELWFCCRKRCSGSFSSFRAVYEAFLGRQYCARLALKAGWFLNEVDQGQ